MGTAYKILSQSMVSGHQILITLYEYLSNGDLAEYAEDGAHETSPVVFDLSEYAEDGAHKDLTCRSRTVTLPNMPKIVPTKTLPV